MQPKETPILVATGKYDNKVDLQDADSAVSGKKHENDNKKFIRQLQYPHNFDHRNEV